MPGFSNLNSLDSSPYDGLFLAEVIDNNDPLQKQRIKVRIANLFDGEVDSLPWVAPLQDSKLGTGTTFGSVSVPRLGSIVVVSFQNSDPHYGMYVGTVHHSTFTPRSELLQNYPDRYGFSDMAGNFFYVDMTQGQVNVEFKHVSGTRILVDNSGSVTIDVVQNSTTNISQNSSVTIGGNSTLSVQGNASLSVQGNSTVSIQGSANVSVSGTIQSSAPSWNHTGNVNITGNISLTGVMTSTGNISSQATISGQVDVSGGGKSLLNHRHIGVRGGTDVSGPPQ